MNSVAAVIGDVYIYRSSVVIALAALSAVFMFLGLQSRSGAGRRCSSLVVPLAIVLSVFFARTIHWYCRHESYGSFISAVTDFRGGGYAMLGVYLGCAAAAGLVRLFRLTDNLPALLDNAAPAGALGIAVGRLSALFTSGDRGMLLESLHSLPFASAVTSPVTGETEYRLATFMFQSLASFVIFAALMFLMRKNARRRDGDIFLIFLLLTGASECLFDSTRYDALFLRSNGFVSIVQICGAISTAVILTVFTVRMVKTRGMRPIYAVLWTITLAFFGGAGYMEYYVQRHGDRAAFAYGMMALCLTGICTVALSSRRASFGAAKRRGLHEKPR